MRLIEEGFLNEGSVAELAVRPPTRPSSYDAFDKLVGRRRWKPPNVGTFVVRFPTPADPGDLGWHVELSFSGETDDPIGSDYSAWRVNIT